MLTFPTHLFNPASVKLALGGITVQGGESLSGVTDTIKTDGGGYWLATLAGVELITPDLIRAWRAWEAELDGGVTKVLVPIADVRQAPRVPGDAPGPLLAGSTELYFPEAVGFATPWIVATITVAAALRATSVTIDVTTGKRLEGGEHFTINHPTVGKRVYRVGRVTARPTATKAVVNIRPPLREAVALNTNVDFDWPAFVGVMVPESDIAPAIEFGRRGVVDIAFREAF